MSKHKVVILTSSLIKSGPNKQNYYILKYLDREIFDPLIVTLSPEQDDSMASLFGELSIPIISVGESRLSGMFKTKNKLIKIINQVKPAIIHSFGVRANHYALKMPAPNIISIRNYPPSDFPDKLGKILGSIIARKYISIIKKHKYRVACSLSIAKEFLEKEKIHLDVITNGVDVDTYAPLSTDHKVELRRKLGLPLNKHIFISSGDLISRKNTDTTIKGFAALKDESTLLLIAGDGSELDRLKSIATKNIEYLGNVSNIAEYYSASDTFISASGSEGLPNSVLEAMASNLICVLSSIQPHLEIVKNNDQLLVYFFPVGSVTNLEKCLRLIVRSEKKVSRNSNRIHVLNNYSAQLMSSSYQHIYETIINKE